MYNSAVCMYATLAVLACTAQWGLDAPPNSIRSCQMCPVACHAVPNSFHAVPNSFHAVPNLFIRLLHK